MEIFYRGWAGLVPPQLMFSAAHFKGIALEPPTSNPGSWTGAGNCVFDPSTERFVLTSRLRTAEQRVRGFAVDVFTSTDGERFDPVHRITKEWVSEVSHSEVQSLEGVQIQRDPLTSFWYCYLSVNYDPEFAWGGVHWQTLLVMAPDLDGPWSFGGWVLKNDQVYDAHHARDASIGIVDGRWLCIYKARDEAHIARPTLATSQDGVNWVKCGPLLVDGLPRSVWMNGTFFASAHGPVFIGLEKPEDEGHPEDDVVRVDATAIGHGGGVRNFVAYVLDARKRNLECIFRTRWHSRSPYEDEKHPVLGYMSIVGDPDRNRLLIYTEAIDPTLSRGIGLNETVERLLVYEARLP